MRNSIPKASGLTEVLFGSVGSGQQSDNTSNPTLTDQVTALDFDAGPGAVMASAVNSGPSSGEANIPSNTRGQFRSPEELGVNDKQTKEQQRRSVRMQARPSERRTSTVNSSRRRSIRVIKSTLTPAATAAAAASIASISSRTPIETAKEPAHEPSKVCSISYRGMEVIFCTSQQSSGTTVLGLCARTRVAFQTLHLPNTLTKSSDKVVSITGHPGTGLVAIAMSDGTIQTYKPVKAIPAPTSSSDEPVSAFGRYRWVNGNIIKCREVFYGKDGSEVYQDVFDDRVSCQSLEKTVDISSSVDMKVLVAHKDQLAVFDATPPDYLMMPDGISPTHGSPSKSMMGPSEAIDAELLWTTRLPANIVTAKISGDGRAIVLGLEGEGEGTPSPYGIRTFIRDLDDGSLVNAAVAPGRLERIDLSRTSSASSNAVGILYKPGPFLVHSTHVSRLSFRGYGHVTSNIRSDEDEGNDLLLTYCKGDCSVRIFSQNSWKQLMHWTTPVDSRADWVHGITAFNLGDLEAPKKKKGGGLPPNSPNSRRPSATSTSSGGSADINKVLLRDRPFNTVAAHSTAPTSAAGAWIAELTFRNAFPALRLSRLSYMKRGGDDAQPAHFESVAAILPAGSLIAESILNSEEMGFSVQGIWPAWNPWQTGPTGSEAGGSLSGSAMALLGLPSGPASTGGLFGESHSGGTHSPPSELRLVASHPLTGKVVIMEFPFWGDQDFGAMELGSPIRHLLSLCEDYSGNHANGCLPNLDEEPTSIDTQGKVETCGSVVDDRVPSFICLDHESNRLCARIDREGKSILLSWRKQANMSIRPLSRSPQTGTRANSDDSIASTASVDSDDSHNSFETFDEMSKENHNLYEDISLLPAPIALPALNLPRNTNGTNSKGEIVAVQWWKDENFGGPPQLLAVTSSGTILLYEMPPPWCALEPTMPSYDPFEVSAAGSVAGSINGEGFDDDSDNDSLGPLRDYDVMVTPHPDFGIGLRLESQADGMPAIAGSFKKHPLSGGRLPAERTGSIVLGDELLSVNDETLEGLSFDNIIATVRDVGLRARPGEALCMKFRPDRRSRQVHSGSAFSGSEPDSGSKRGVRRTKQEILGESYKGATERKSKQVEEKGEVSSSDSQTSIRIGAEGEMQQEFCRIIAIVRHALPEVALSGQSNFLLLPWNGRPGSTHSLEVRGEALLVTAENSSIIIRKFAVAADNDAEKARCIDVGKLDLSGNDSREATNIKTIQTIALIDSDVGGWCLSVLDSDGAIFLIFIDIGVDARGMEIPNISFRHHKIVQKGHGSPSVGESLIRTASMDLIGIMTQTVDGCKRVQVWSSCPDPSSTNDDDAEETEYLMSTVAISPSRADPKSEEEHIVDFRFVPSGRLDAFPWLVIFTKKSATVYRREAGDLLWKSIAKLLLKPLENSILTSDSSPADFGTPVFSEPNISPADAYPHLVPTLRNIVSATDERSYLRSDWHPDSILAYVCTEKDGAYSALRRSVRGIFIWLARWMNDDVAARPLLEMNFPLGTTPFRALNCEEPKEDNGLATEESASSLMASLSFASKKEIKPKSEEEILLDKLRTALCPSNTKVNKDKASYDANKLGKSKEFLLAMKNSVEDKKESCLPPPLKKLNRDEIRLLWAMGELLVQPPKSKNLDSQAQLSLFCICLCRKIMEAKNDDEKEDVRLAKTRPNIPTSIGGRPLLVKRNSYLVKKKSSFAPEEPNIPPAVASAGCLSALASNCQAELLERSKIPNEKLDWETARKMRIPFWIRSDDILCRISEEIGQRTYKDKRDIMESAIFFIAARNFRTLRNLAATDRSDSGRKFLKFITSHDFKSDRGRKAAEKNAYSLLRKRRYIVASAFFLMAEPPMLKTALEVIVTQMQDIDLAFLVSRLIDRKDQSSSETMASSGFVGGISGGFGLGGVLGGGGGFAASAMVSEPQVQHDEEKFSDWRPNLSQGTKTLLNERGLDLAKDDHCMRAIQLIWMGQVEEATCCLSGAPTRAGRSHKNDVIVPQSFDLPTKAGPRTSANERVIFKANTLINFCSSPFLLKALKYSIRARWASSIVVARALSRRGIDIPSMRILLHQTDASELKEGYSNILSKELAKNNPHEQNKGDGMKSHSNEPASSIFDTFDACATAKPVKKESAVNGQMSSSIFDGFDAPGNATHRKQNKVDKSSQQEKASTSIFDSFDVPARPSNVPSAPKPDAQTGGMASSIFDSFDTAPKASSVKAATDKPTPQSGEMSSSIFDSYVAPRESVPSKKPSDPIPASQKGEMSSSIFDSFDAPLPAKSVRNISQPTQADQMSSSIFDSFDPPSRAPTQKSQSQQDAKVSSIFDSFDVPSKPSVKNSNTSKQTTQPSIFDSYDMPNPHLKKEAAPTETASSEIQAVLSGESEEPKKIALARKTPDLWLDLRKKILQVSAARRLLREVARLVDRFHGDAIDPPMALFRRHIHPLIPLSATEILRSHCDGQALLGSVKRSLAELCDSCNMNESAVVDEAIRILACKSEPRRIVFAVIFYSVLDRADLVEDAIREASQKQIQQCESFAFSNDDLVYGRKTIHHVSSQYLRRQAARLSWQLELCLWLHRGGAYPLCAIATKEAIVAVRIGLLVASWGRNHECVEKMIKCEPDCRMDDDAGRQIWSSMKMISSSVESGTSGLASSGGWEFLVDCRREEATEMLRNRPTGAFILRPHAEDHGVFTLSFKTNLIPSADVKQENAKSGNTADENVTRDDEASKGASKPVAGGLPPKAAGTRPVKKDEVVQHAILRLSDAGFRCGSFGPFTSLMKLLEAVSASLPFDLLFNAPPTESVIKDQGAQPSPNALLLRKIALCSQSENYRWNRSTLDSSRNSKALSPGQENDDCDEYQDTKGKKDANAKENFATRKRFGMFTQLLALSEVRKQLSSVVSAEYDELAADESSWQGDTNGSLDASQNLKEEDSLGSFSKSADELGVEELYAISARILRPFLCWCRMIETGIVFDLAPPLSRVTQATAAQPVAMVVSETEIEVAPNDVGSRIDGGDAVIRQLIQPDSGVEFRTVRVGEGGDSAMIVLFDQAEAIEWFLSTGVETDRHDALARLQLMEKGRVIERVDLHELSVAHDVRYRFVDPWEVEALESKEGETTAASLGREHFFEFSVARVAQACDSIQRSLGGLHLMALWSAAKGGIFLSKAFATVHAPWERDAGGDLQMTRGHAAEPPQYSNSIRQHLYRNALFRRLKVPQRYLALVQVELLDLKNLTSPGGSVALSVYALLRLKRPGSGAPLTHKARTLDSACTEPKRVGKTSGPNAPASWGTLVRFRFPLPEDVNCDGISYDGDREVLFKGAPSVLQLSVYEKKFMNDISLGEADVKLDALASGSQLEEWVPLKAAKHGITWFARIRLTLRFELMCLPSNDDDLEDVPPSVGLRKIHQLSQLGGAHEDTFSKSLSTPDLLSYFESMVY